jgi:integrase
MSQFKNTAPAGRPRNPRTAKGLLDRMEARVWADGKTVTYRYHPVNGKPINLGRDRLAACRQVLDLIGAAENTSTLTYVWESYANAAKPAARWKKLSEATKADYRQAWKALEKSFGKMDIARIDSPMVARYVHIERADSPKRANTEKALLSNLFGHGILLGACTVNATIGVQPHEMHARSVAPDAAVLAGFLAWLDRQTPQRRIIGMAAEYASLAGNRQVEFLPLTWPQVDFESGVVRTFRAKQRGRNREQIVEAIHINAELRSLLSRLEAIRPNLQCQYVFPTRSNTRYSDKGFKALWQRCVHAAIQEKVLRAEDRFTFNDLRAFYATRHKKVIGALPDLHKNPQTTARVYDRNKVIGRESF